MSEERESWNLVMPFVVCASNGGRYEDNSFVAGYRAGGLDQTLRHLAVLGATGMIEVPVERSLVPQLDLIAMRHGFTSETESTTDTSEWVMWRATKP